MVGAPQYDPAHLDDWINPYVGATGPTWEPRYTQTGSTTVLVVEVSPPRPGDKIHTLRKEHGNFHKGTVFGRKNGKTHPADPEDMENLERRSRGTWLNVYFGLGGANLGVLWVVRGAMKGAWRPKGCQVEVIRTRKHR